MSKFTRSLMFLFTITILIFIIVPGNYSSAAETEFHLTKTNQMEYKDEVRLVFTEDITQEDFNIYSEDCYPEVKEIIAAEGVTYFDWDFLLRGYFPNLERVTLSSTVAKIHYTEIASKGLEKLKEIIVAEANANYIAIDNCLYNKDMTILVQYPIGSTKISYVMPDTVTTILHSTFDQAKYLQTVSIGAKLQEGQLQAKGYHLSHIKEFKINRNNPYYSVIDGVLFSKTGDTLLLYPKGKGTSYRVPEGTITIEATAFIQNELKYIKLPSTLKTVEDGTFVNCSKLITITIPKAVSKINVDDFKMLSSLEAIHVESGNKLYASYKGILYNTAKTYIKFVPMAYKETSLKFPSTLVSLFTNIKPFENATEIVIPRDVKKLNAKGSSHFFEKITLEAGNENFVLYKGSVYNKSKTNLVLFKQQKKAEFPSTLTYIDINFLYESGITEMVIPAKAKIPSFLINVYNIPTLKKVSVDKNNPYYSVQNNMLLSKDKTILYDTPRNLTVLKIPATVKKISLPMNFSINNIKSIVIPKSVTELDESLYIDHISLENIEVEKGNTKFTSKNGILYNKDFTEMIFYPTNKKDKTYVMPDTVKTMNHYFITENPNLESITLSKMLEPSNNYYFAYSKTLKEINVNKDNSSYKSVNGVLYNKDMTELIAYPYQKRDKSFTIPDTVITVSGLNCRVFIQQYDTSFSLDGDSNPYLETLIIGKNVKTLFESHFNYPIWGFKNLQNLSISKDNPYFTIKDGALYNKDMSIMYLYMDSSKNTVFTIPAQVKEISERVFEAIASNKYLKTIVIEDGNQYFSTDGLTLRTFTGNYKYCKLGEEYQKRVY
ncbi:MAG: leucine-rich repeat protein [Mobilitalea sp.]